VRGRALAAAGREVLARLAVQQLKVAGLGRGQLGQNVGYDVHAVLVVEAGAGGDARGGGGGQLGAGLCHKQL